ncbi:MAG: hypothetical protein LUE64_00715 [Candidatus Gastranaerophilales bacterium]|nr:hypothetical protein [Candidatus Gastranaerophilales bacterium]
MKRKLSRSGNGWSIFIPKVIIELLEINPECDDIDLKIENNTLLITKAKPVSKDEADG